MGFAAGLAVIALVAVASAGGVSAVQSTTHSAVKVIKKLGASSTTSPTVVSSAAADQYKGKCGKPPKPKCHVSINDVTGSEASGTFTFTVSIDATPLDTIVVSYSTRSGTATSGADFGPTSGTVTFFPGDASPKTVTVTVVNDTAKEKNEAFYVDITSADAIINRTPGKGTIIDND